jgi:hypothetical protein
VQNESPRRQYPPGTVAPIYSLLMNAPIEMVAPKIQEARKKVRISAVIPTIPCQGVWQA